VELSAAALTARWWPATDALPPLWTPAAPPSAVATPIPAAEPYEVTATLSILASPARATWVGVHAPPLNGFVAHRLPAASDGVIHALTTKVDLATGAWVDADAGMWESDAAAGALSLTEAAAAWLGASALPVRAAAALAAAADGDITALVRGASSAADSQARWASVRGVAGTDAADAADAATAAAAGSGATDFLPLRCGATFQLAAAALAVPYSPAFCAAAARAVLRSAAVNGAPFVAATKEFAFRALSGSLPASLASAFKLPLSVPLLTNGSLT
jgi:hypothetical protein